MRQTTLSQDLKCIDFAGWLGGWQEVEIADYLTFIGGETTGSESRFTVRRHLVLSTNAVMIFLQSEIDAFVFFPPQCSLEGPVVWWLEGISALRSPISPWSGAKLLPNKTGCIPRAPPSSLQSALVFAPFI